MWSGIWPPSKPAIETPERALAPFWPRPAVLPRPEPMPRPTRTRDWRAPLLSLISFSFIVCTRFRFCRALFPCEGRGPVQRKESGLLPSQEYSQKLRRFFDPHQMRHLADLAENLGGLAHFDRAAELVEAEADERRPLRLVAADRRSGLRDLDFRHEAYSTTA